MSRALCRLDDIPDGEGRGFTLAPAEAEALAGGERDVFVVRRGGHAYGYVNSCPHVGTPLDWEPDRFMSRDRAHVQCATHGALFRIEDGVCVAGPCPGKKLRRLPLDLRDGEILV